MRPPLLPPRPPPRIATRPFRVAGEMRLLQRHRAHRHGEVGLLLLELTRDPLQRRRAGRKRPDLSRRPREHFTGSLKVALPIRLRRQFPRHRGDLLRGRNQHGGVDRL